jgi:hypothetical protein
MTPDATTVLVARSRSKAVVLLALGAVSIVLTYVGLSAFDTSLPIIGLRQLRWPPRDLAAFFLFLAAVSFGTTVWQVWRRLNQSVDVVADSEGITSQQSFWGRGRLTWSEITRVESKYRYLLYIYGISPAGDAKWLMIDTRQIDVPAADLYAVIARHRPDLVSKPRS